jgi:hypothetical protein
LKNPSQKRDGGVAQGAGPEFKPQHSKKKKKKSLSILLTILNNQLLALLIFYTVSLVCVSFTSTVIFIISSFCLL